MTNKKTIQLVNPFTLDAPVEINVEELKNIRHVLFDAKGEFTDNIEDAVCASLNPDVTG
jgi:hypothetical protein